MTTMQKGFTLIELMIVIAIIGILAAIAVPQYQDYTIRTQVSEGMNLAAEAKTAVGDFYATRGRLPTVNGSAGIAAPTSLTGNYVTGITVAASGALTVTYGNRVNQKVAGNTLGLNTARNPAGGLVWICGNAGLPGGATDTSGANPSTNLNPRYLPSDCRN